MNAADYAFMTKTVEQNPYRDEMTVLDVKDRKIKCVSPISVPKKGVDENVYSLRCVSRVMNLPGYHKMIMRYDQESALRRVLADV